VILEKDLAKFKINAWRKKKGVHRFVDLSGLRRSFGNEKRRES